MTSESLKRRRELFISRYLQLPHLNMQSSTYLCRSAASLVRSNTPTGGHRAIFASNSFNPRQLHTTAIPSFLIPSFQPSQQYQYDCSRRLSQKAAQLPRKADRRARREFSTTPLRKDVNVITNPRKDDDGKDMVVDITPRAANVSACDHIALASADTR